MAFDLSDPVRALREMAQAISDLQTATPLANASIGRGTLTVYDGGIILIDNGGLKIVGWADILGSLEVTGQINGTGDLNWAGKAFFDGPAEITDTLKVLAATSLEGLVTLMNDLVLATGGKITSGHVVIDPSDNGGTVKVGDLKIVVTGGGVNLSAYGHQIVFSTAGISIVTAGGKNIILQDSPNVFRLGGLPTIARSAANNATIGTVYSTPTGDLSRVIA